MLANVLTKNVSFWIDKNYIRDFFYFMTIKFDRRMLEYKEIILKSI